MKIKEYIPGYFSGFDKHASDFSTKEDLLNIDWIKCESDREGFSGYMVDGDCLVSTYNYNTNKKPSWYVIGYFDDNETVNCIKKWFPHWGHPKYIMNNGDVVEIQLTYFDKMKINITREEFLEIYNTKTNKELAEYLGMPEPTLYSVIKKLKIKKKRGPKVKEVEFLE